MDRLTSLRVFREIVETGSFAAAAKQLGVSAPMASKHVAELEQATGALEVVGALALVTPFVSGVGALLLLCVDVGAFFAQIALIHGDWIHTIVIGAILAALVYWQRAQIRARLGL